MNYFIALAYTLQLGKFRFGRRGVLSRVDVTAWQDVVKTCQSKDNVHGRFFAFSLSKGRVINDFAWVHIWTALTKSLLSSSRLSFLQSSSVVSEEDKRQCERRAEVTFRASEESDSERQRIWSIMKAFKYDYCCSEANKSVKFFSITSTTWN